MVPRDPMISDDETGRFAEEVIECIARHGNINLDEAKELYDRSMIPGGLNEAPDYYLHESPYYWAIFVLTGKPAGGQDPSSVSPAVIRPPETESLMTWGEVQQLIRTTALPVRSINWKGRADCPEAAWIITTLDGQGNKLQRPDHLAGNYLLLSAENVDSPTTRMLSSTCGFPLHIFKRIPEKPVRYQYLGLGTVVEFDTNPSYPHWKIELRPVNPVGWRQLGS